MTPPGRTRDATRTGFALFLASCAATAMLALATSGLAEAAPSRTDTPECAAGVDFLGFSDALNKRTYEGTSVGGLSALAYDGRRGGVYYGLVDNGPTPGSEARFYTLRLPTKGGALGTPEILDVTTLREASGEPFTASNFDGEGLTLMRSGDLLASSETEPSIRRFSLEGELLEELPVPQKFRVAPEGQARRNQTFESLALSPNNRACSRRSRGRWPRTVEPPKARAASASCATRTGDPTASRRPRSSTTSPTRTWASSRSWRSPRTSCWCWSEAFGPGSATP